MAKNVETKRGYFIEPINLNGYVLEIKASNKTGKVTITIDFGKNFCATQSNIYGILRRKIIII